MTPIEETVAGLRAKHVSEAIIARVVRLNPHPRPSHYLRGIHYKRFDNPVIHTDCLGKGAFLKRYGRKVFAHVPRHALIKRGRRVFITRQGLEIARKESAK